MDFAYQEAWLTAYLGGRVSSTTSPDRARDPGLSAPGGLGLGGANRPQFDRT